MEGTAQFDARADRERAERQMAEYAARSQRQGERAEELMKLDPRLPFVTALIIAGDEASTALADERLESGDPFERVVWLVGSFARLDWALRQVDEQRVSIERVEALLPELWRGSDPDDANPRYLALWRDAYEHNGHIILDDPERPLKPTHGRAVAVYRGQDADARLGIAWTTSEGIARKFADGAATRQSHRGGIVHKSWVSVDVALAYLTGRGEEEVIVDPSTLSTVITEREASYHDVP